VIRRTISALACLAACLNFGGTARAAIVDTPHFKVEGVVIVWSDQGGDTAPILPRFPAEAGRAVSHTIAVPHLYGSGQLQLASDIRERPATAATVAATRAFNVASNTAFSIDAELVGISPSRASDLDKIKFAMRMDLGSGTRGRRAQYPHPGGPTGGMATDITTLAHLTSRATVFRGTRPTAARRGSIVEQSVRFEAHFERAASVIVADGPLPDIVFPVYIP